MFYLIAENIKPSIVYRARLYQDLIIILQCLSETQFCLEKYDTFFD